MGRNHDYFREVKEERQAIQQRLQEQGAEAKEAARQKADRVRLQHVACAAQRARSEDLKHELVRGVLQGRYMREENDRIAKQELIETLESEEARLIERLQFSQEQHRIAYQALEDALAEPQGATPSHPLAAAAPQFSSAYNAAREGSRASAAKAALSAALPEPLPRSDSRPPPPRPPRPRSSTPGLAPVARAAHHQAAAPAQQAATSAPLGSARAPLGPKPLAPQERRSVASDQSTTASGPSGNSSPSCGNVALKYTTVEGAQLEITVDDDLDLDALLRD